MYCSLRKKCYCPQMASDVFLTVQKCRNFIQVRRVQFRHQKLMEFVPAARSPRFVAMSMLGSLKNAVWRNAFSLDAAHQFTKIRGCNFLQKTGTVAMTAEILEYCVYAYGSPKYHLTNSRKQFIPEFLDSD